MRLATLTLPALLAVLGAAPAARATPEPGGAVWYRARAGDTPELIAAEFYGDRDRAPFVRAANKLVRARPLRAGERLRIPVVAVHVTSPGDTFESLAARLLGDPRRAPLLAEANRRTPSDDLPAGTALDVPFVVTYVAPRAEPLEAVAAAFLGDRRLAEALRQFNGLDKSALAPGESIEVPSLRVRMHPARRPGATGADAKARRDRRADTERRAATALPAARLAWRVGDHAAVRRALEPLDLDYLDRDAAIEIGVMLGATLVAFDATEPARAAFQRVLARAPTHALRRFDHAPRVLEVWVAAGGRIQ